MRERGFSLLEMTVALGVVMGATAAIFGMTGRTQSAFLAREESADLEQRLRVATDTLTRAITMAGAGPHLGLAAGPLVGSLAPVLPFRAGATHPDPPGTFRTDTVTVVSSVPSATQTTTTRELSGPFPELAVSHSSHCPAAQPMCGVGLGMTLLVFDRSGAFGLFRVSGLLADTAQLESLHPRAALSLPSGSTVVQASTHTYYLDAATSRLMYYDGSSNPDVPVVDHVVGLAFEYYGQALPPQVTGPLSSSPSGRATTYGPSPPPPDQSLSTGDYPAGENCLFSMLNGVQTARLPLLEPNRELALVRLTRPQLIDGPWCPNGSTAARWDGDLLRIRRIRVTLRLEASSARLRGPSSSRFVNAGTASSVDSWLPDRQASFDVTPRNLALSN